MNNTVERDSCGREEIPTVPLLDVVPHGSELQFTPYCGVTARMNPSLAPPEYGPWLGRPRFPYPTA